jgi:hypothetical protein
MLSNEVMDCRRFEESYRLHLQVFRSPTRALLQLTSAVSRTLEDKSVGSFETSELITMQEA